MRGVPSPPLPFSYPPLQLDRRVEGIERQLVEPRPLHLCLSGLPFAPIQPPPPLPPLQLDRRVEGIERQLAEARAAAEGARCEASALRENLTASYGRAEAHIAEVRGRMGGVGR